MLIDMKPPVSPNIFANPSKSVSVRGLGVAKDRVANPAIVIPIIKGAAMLPNVLYVIATLCGNDSFLWKNMSLA